VCSSLIVRDQVSHPYKTTGRIMVLYILTFKFLDSRREDRRLWTEQFGGGGEKTRTSQDTASSFWTFRTGIQRRAVLSLCCRWSVRKSYGGLCHAAAT
jgi:hypothetical protein